MEGEKKKVRLFNGKEVTSEGKKNVTNITATSDRCLLKSSQAYPPKDTMLKRKVVLVPWSAREVAGG